MCGIAGGSGALSAETVGAMTAALRHRGPDDEGLFVEAGVGVLGHRRLAIVDPTGGQQPLVASPTEAIVVNGEIYNAPQLREDLAGAPWLSGSDSEVALRVLAAEDDPVAAAARLHGMFAFAAQRDGELLLARDPIGIKPLYRGTLGGDTVFASEVKAFAPGTTDVAALVPGTLWSSVTGERRFAGLPLPDPVQASTAEHVAAVRASLERSVERHLMSDVPVGAFLSGGLDSSLICALIARRVPELHTFACGFAGSPDLAAARVVAAHLGTTHHERVVEPHEVAEALPEILWFLESTDPDLVRSAVPTWFVAELAAQHVKVVMTGEGADELYAGYRYHGDLRREVLAEELHRSITEMHHVNLQRVDRMTMAHGLEARVPFLDLDVLETAAGVPVDLKLPEGGPEKWVLRQAFADLLPDEVTWRTKSQFDEGSGVGDLVDAALLDRWSVADPSGREPLERVLASVAGEEMCRHVAAVSGRWSSGRLRSEERRVGKECLL